MCHADKAIVFVDALQARVTMTATYADAHPASKGLRGVAWKHDLAALSMTRTCQCDNISVCAGAV